VSRPRFKEISAMKFEIKHRGNGSVLFSLETTSLKLCVEAAVKSGVNLHGVNLHGANLSGAYLSGAYLYGANLSGVNLHGAYLYGANLSGANLYGANLYGAYLHGAYLYGANLSGANLSGANLSGNRLVGERPFLSIGPIGSRAEYLNAFLTEAGVRVKTGCFFGTLDEFAEAVKTKHGTNVHADEYEAARRLILWHAHHWTPTADALSAERAEWERKDKELSEKRTAEKAAGPTDSPNSTPMAATFRTTRPAT
jgi:uncharacterized protein YjbI with pentapeptide repeats